MAEPNVAEGQVESGLAGAIAQTPVGEVGQSAVAEQTTEGGPDSKTDDSFFDPNSIKGNPELEKAYKQMQAAYTKHAQKFAENRNKLEAYDSFMKDPVTNLRQLAAQYGIPIAQPTQEVKSWEPQTWEDVMVRARDEAKKEIYKDLSPVFEEVKNLRKTNIEKSLEEIDPQWRLYEEDMMSNLKEHPTLVSSPDKLYRLSVPEKVIMAKATQTAVSKLRGKTDAAQISGGSTTTKTANQVPRGPMSFSDAVKVAEAQLAERGMKRPG